MGFIATIFGPLPIVMILALASSVVLPGLQGLRSTSLDHLYFLGLACGATGIVLLIQAKWPLYRQGIFKFFGWTTLDRKHRKIGFLAYGFLIAFLVLMFLVWRKAA